MHSFNPLELPSSTGGFAGNADHDEHLLYTLSAVQILVIFDALDVLSNQVDDEGKSGIDRVVEFVSQLQQPDGSFAGDKWGEIDSRFAPFKEQKQNKRKKERKKKSN